MEEFESYVKDRGGQTVIRKVLIANNGIAAVKAIRSIRRWTYEQFGNERLVEFTVMATPEDVGANAEFVRLADTLVSVPGGSNNHNYANVELIVDIVERFRCDAVWAGWGHASENPKLPRRLAEIGVRFMGPGASAMHALGDKVASTILAQSAQVPTVPWSGQGLIVDYREEGRIPPDMFQKACVQDEADAVAVCTRIGYPVMIKASEGGGGKGIRMVEDEGTVRKAFRQVCSEVPGSPVFIMRLVRDARHLEVQIVADEYGEAIALFGRDCSVQRRHQKIIEEGPVVAAPPTVWKKLEQAAVRLAKEVGYVGAGTVEYLYTGDAEGGEFFFLELNPRLQVEHPVTEWITGVNLPALQLNIAMGVPLGHVPDVLRLFSLSDEDRGVSLSDRAQRAPRGHVIACRVTAENPDENFQPTSGGIQELTFRNTPNVWGYFSVGATGGVHEFSDSQFGHLFAWGEDREIARRAMVLALKELSIRGDIRTTVEYLARLLELDDFRSNRIHTRWLDRLIAERIARQKPEPELAVVCAALCWSRAFFEGEERKAVQALERGQLPAISESLITTSIELIYEDVKYSLGVSRAASSVFRVRLNGSALVGTVRALSDGGNIVLLDCKSHVAYLREETGGLHMVLDGMTCLFPREYDPTTLVSTVNGKLVRYLVADGEELAKGAAYAELEVMKMYLNLLAPEAGRVKLELSAGSVVSVGDVLARLELNDPSQVRVTTVFEGKLPDMRMPEQMGSKPHQRFRAAFKEVELLMEGYDANADAPQALLELATNPLVLVGELQEALSEGVGRIPAALYELLEEETRKLRESAAAAADDAFGAIVAQLLGTLREREIEADGSPAGNVRHILDRHSSAGGLKATVISDLLERYMIVIEKPFARGKSAEDVLFDLREAYRNDLRRVVETAISHMQVKRKTKLTLTLLEHISDSGLFAVARTRACVEELSKFFSPEYAEVALRSRLMLAEFQLPQLKEKLDRANAAIRDLLETPGERERELTIARYANLPEMELLACFILPPQNAPEGERGNRNNVGDKLVQRRDFRLAAAELHITCAYRGYSLDDVAVEFDEVGGFLRAQWRFSLSGSAPEVERNALEIMLGANSSASMASSGAARKSLESFGLSPGGDVANGGDGGADGEGVPVRVGTLAAFESMEDMSNGVDRLLEVFESELHGSKVGSVNILTLVVRLGIGTAYLRGAADIRDIAAGRRPVAMLESQISRMLTDFWRNSPPERKALVARCGIKTITYIVLPDDELSEYPGLYTLKVGQDFAEDTIYRHIHPPMAFQLELSRLVNFEIQRFDYPNRLIHVFFGENVGGARPRTASRENEVGPPPPSGKKGDVDSRFFVRAVIPHPTVFSKASDTLVAIPEAEKTFLEALDALELGRCNPHFRHADLNHIFLNLVQPIPVDMEDVEAICRRLFLRYAARCWKLHVFAVEVRVQGVTGWNSNDFPLRFVLFNPTGHALRVEGYQEMPDPGNAFGNVVLVSLKADGDGHGHLHLKCPTEPYQTMDRLQRKRVIAQTLESTYVYDFQHIFSRALYDRWRQYKHSRLRGGFRRVKVPVKQLDVVELVLDESGLLQPVSRPQGMNDHGIVVWRMTLYTPEYPEGRDIIVIANDITFLSGSFGPKEDAAFAAASRLAREDGVPRVYIAANAGARIGLADEVRRAFKVRWLDENDPSKGFSDLFLDEADRKALADYVNVDDDGRLVDVIGKEDALGIENLMGSGLIAREASAAYEETFTLTYVTARSVGIGAYLVRLGQRVIQRESNAPIILTGYSALNKVLGREVYVSNEQLGGAKIMRPNGVTHVLVKDDIEGVGSILDWLSFVPSKRGERLPAIEPLDPIDREVTFCPLRGTPYDPRHLIAGDTDLTGIFDRDSWMETLSAWARSVVTGRARLGGIPVGVIAVETRTVDKTSPADPASPETRETVDQQAGQVWYPDSSQKTAQAIRDLNREGLPLFILANWRGFSGGMRDMFDEILKFGAQIVDALREYSQPVFVYIPPGGELRGGAWVVLDTSINPDMIEMYVDDNARAGVLEPEGTVEVKYRRRELTKTMHRLDPDLQELDAGLNKEDDSKDGSSFPLSSLNRKRLRNAIEAREAALLSIYRQVATKFADLHDTPGRMLAKGAIRKVVACRQARNFFYWRLQRRLAELKVRREIAAADDSLTRSEVTTLLRRWAEQSDVLEGKGESNFDTDDQSIYQWLEDCEEQIQRRIETVREGRVARTTGHMVRRNAAAVMAGLEAAMSDMEERERGALAVSLQKLVDSTATASVSPESHKTVIAGLLSRLRLYSSGEARDHASAERTNTNPKPYGNPESVESQQSL